MIKEIIYEILSSLMYCKYFLTEAVLAQNDSYIIYDNRLPSNFLNILGESKYICYQVLDEIIYDIFESSIIEPFVEIHR